MQITPWYHTVQYYETDKMGVAHHSNHIRWFEEARVDFLEKIGASYIELEKRGVISPVLTAECKYRRSATFGDTVAISCTIASYNGIRLIFDYRAYNEESGEVYAEGRTSHCFLDSEKDMKVTTLEFRCPDVHRILCDRKKTDEAPSKG